MFLALRIVKVASFVGKNFNIHALHARPELIIQSILPIILLTFLFKKLSPIIQVFQSILIIYFQHLEKLEWQREQYKFVLYRSIFFLDLCLRQLRLEELWRLQIR